MGEDAFSDLKKLLPGILENLKTPEKQNRSTLVSEWSVIAGKKIAAHTKPILLAKGELCVWVDQAVLAYELSQKYKNALLKRAQKILGKETVKKIRFCVGQIR